jgi:hypothetical protein
MSWPTTPEGTTVSLSRKDGAEWGISIDVGRLLTPDQAVELADAISAATTEARDRNRFEAETRKLYFCTYCDYYTRRWDGRRDPNARPVFTGTRSEVIEHARCHPIGDPRDMALPISERAPYRA